jgi:hypothetical protein
VRATNDDCVSRSAAARLAPRLTGGRLCAKINLDLTKKENSLGLFPSFFAAVLKVKRQSHLLAQKGFSPLNDQKAGHNSWKSATLTSTVLYQTAKLSLSPYRFTYQYEP